MKKLVEMEIGQRVMVGPGAMHAGRIGRITEVIGDDVTVRISQQNVIYHHQDVLPLYDKEEQNIILDFGDRFSDDVSLFESVPAGLSLKEWLLMAVDKSEGVLGESTMNKDGRVYMPVKVQRFLGVKPGEDSVEFSIEQGQVFLTKRNDEQQARDEE